MKSFIEWTENELVNFDIIDTQHTNLVNLINEIHSKLGKLEIKDSLLYSENLVSELRTHFDTEEGLMKQHRYQGYISHKLEHDRLYNKMNGFLSEIRLGNKSITLNLLDSLKTWLFNHLELNDRKCALHFREQKLNLSK